jgi:iron complex outermembrane receptor protein
MRPLPPRSLTTSRIDQSRDGYGGVYLQDQVALTSKLKITGEIRYDVAKLKDVGYFVTVSSSSRATAWSPRAGLTYQPIRAISFYATFNRSFQPQTGTDVNGVAFRPELGRLLETGFKFDTAEHRIQGTASVYQINQTNARPNSLRRSMHVCPMRAERSMEDSRTRKTAPQLAVTYPVVECAL